MPDSSFTRESRPADSSVAVWYVANATGQHEGPLAMDELRQRARDGRLLRADLLWKEGFPAWTPAADVPNVFSSHTTIPSVVSNPSPAATVVSKSQNLVDEVPRLAPVENVVANLSRSRFFYLTARVSAVLAVLALVASLALVMFGYSLFLWSMCFFMLFVGCQGVALILDRLDRLESMLKR